MDLFNDNELRKLLQCYEVDEPRPELVSQTKNLMREEVVKCAAETEESTQWVFTLVLLGVLMSLCLFYMLTVGTILHFTLPSNLMEWLNRSLYVLSAAGGCLLAGASMVVYFQQFHSQRVSIW